MPSLRNIALTSPYMHNASIATLQDVLDHYTQPKADDIPLDQTLIAVNGTRALSLTEQEKEDIVSFLRTLTDQSFRTNAKFRDN